MCNWRLDRKCFGTWNKKIESELEFFSFLFSAKTWKSIAHDPALSQVRIEERRRFLPTIRWVEFCTFFSRGLPPLPEKRKLSADKAPVKW